MNSLYYHPIAMLLSPVYTVPGTNLTQTEQVNSIS